MRVLCASWHYPPSSEIAGKVTYRLMRALAARGHAVTVVTVPDDCIAHVDADFGADPGPPMRIVRVPPAPDRVATLAAIKGRLQRKLAGSAPDTHHAAGARRSGSRIADWLQFPDRGRLWTGPLRRALDDIIERAAPDVLFTVSPPLSTHFAVPPVLARHPGLRWWAWMHDPVSNNPFHHRSRRRTAWLQRREREVMDHATGLCVTTPELADETERVFGRRPSVLLCGFDEDELPPPTPPHAGPLTMTHAGTLYGHRTPRPLLEAIALLVRQGTVRRTEIRIRFIGDAGDLHGETLADMVNRLDLTDLVVIDGPISHAQALRAVQAGHIGLVLAENQPTQVPAKAFDYAGLQRPILAIADGATARFVRDYNLGVVADRMSLPHAITTLVADFRRDGLQALTDAMRARRGELTIATQATLLDGEFRSLGFGLGLQRNG